jgi:hypothetical protein
MTELKVGDLVYPSDINPHHFNKNAVFPWKVVKVEGLSLWLEHKTKGGKRIVDMWYLDFWQLGKDGRLK